MGIVLAGVIADGAGLRAAADEDAAFEVGVHRPAGEVGAADQGGAVVHNNDLGVKCGAGRAMAGGPAQPQRQ